MTSIMDRYIERDLYQLFVTDTSLWFFAGAIITILIYYLRIGRVFVWHWYLYFGVSFLGIIVTFVIQSKRVRGDLRLFKFNAGQLMIMIANGVILYFSYKRWITAGFILETFTEEVLIASWEQLAFGILAPVAILFIFRLLGVQGWVEIPVFVLAIIISSLGFAFAHAWVYESLATIAYLFGVGVVLMTLCYTFSPSLSISLHLLNNIVLMTKGGIL